MLPILLSIGPVHLYSLSVFLVLSWLVFSFLFWKKLRSLGVIEEQIFDLSFYATIAGFICSRLGFVLFHPSLFSGTPLKILAIWVQPGLAFYPGLAAGLLVFLYLAKKHDIRLGMILDSFTPALNGSLIVGSIGVFLGGSIVGLSTKLPWALPVVGKAGLRHPVPLYQTVFFILLLLWIFYCEGRAKKKDWPYGLTGVVYFLVFAPVLFGLEFLIERTVYWGHISANQWMLVLLGSYAFGAFYVRGGLRTIVNGAVRQKVTPKFARISQFYERIRKRFTFRGTKKP